MILELLSGGGKLEDTGLEAKTAFEAAKQLGSEAAKVSRHSVLKLLLARNCHSYCCRRYELRSSLPELGTHPQFRNADLHKKSAFTLAEVLITLGIIGVVAALTLPSVMNKYRSFVLEQQFKKSYSNLSQTIINMKRDTGIENLRDYYYGYNSSLGRHDASLLGSFYSDFDSHIVPVDKLKKIYPVTNYSGTGTSATDYGEDWPKATIILKDGSSVGRYANNGCLRFWIDSNGPYKKPNRYGFDIFEFRVCDSTDILKPVKAWKNDYTDEELENAAYPDYAGQPCTKNSKQLLNGVGCSWYALNNINPDDNSKKYWDSLPW